MRRCGLILVAVLCLLQGQPGLVWAQVRSDDASQPASAQSPSKSRPAIAVSGTVFDPSVSAIRHAKVSLVRPDGSTVGQTSTDSSGGFRIEAPQTGNYVLSVQADGFQDLRRDLS